MNSLFKDEDNMRVIIYFIYIYQEIKMFLTISPDDHLTIFFMCYLKKKGSIKKFPRKWDQEREEFLLFINLKLRYQNPNIPKFKKKFLHMDNLFCT